MLNGNGGNITLEAGTGGILSASANNSTAEVATTGTVYLYTSGPVGTSNNRIQFTDSAVVAVDYIDWNWSPALGSPAAPSSVFLDGLGSLTLGHIYSDGVVNVTARTNLTVTGTVENVGYALSLAADVRRDGSGDDGVGTL